MLRPVCVLEMPHRPLLPREKVLHLQARGGIAARVCAEPGGDLKPSIGDSVVPGTKAWPIPKALLPSTLLLETSAVKTQYKSQQRMPLTESMSETQNCNLTLPFSLKVKITHDQHKLFF